jgi:hypothetical protein
MLERMALRESEGCQSISATRTFVEVGLDPLDGLSE